jgi:hypothetical protein
LLAQSMPFASLQGQYPLSFAPAKKIPGSVNACGVQDPTLYDKRVLHAA